MLRIGHQGRRAPLRCALAPGYNIARRWRCDILRRCDMLRAIGADTRKLIRFKADDGCKSISISIIVRWESGWPLAIHLDVFCDFRETSKTRRMSAIITTTKSAQLSGFLKIL
jgi:hypothetical protein